jgi:hypothetical protein
MKLGNTLVKIKTQRKKAQKSVDPLLLELTKELATAEARSAKAERISASAVGYPVDPPKINANKNDAYTFAWEQAQADSTSRKRAVLRSEAEKKAGYRPTYEHFWYQERVGRVFEIFAENGAANLTYGDAFIKKRQAEEQSPLWSPRAAGSERKVFEYAAPKSVREIWI